MDASCQAAERSFTVGTQVCLTDVEGLFTGAPDLPDSELIPTYSPAVHDPIIKFGAKSTMGRGGMSSKVESAWGAALEGVSTLIINGKGFRPALVEAVSAWPPPACHAAMTVLASMLFA